MGASGQLWLIVGAALVVLVILLNASVGLVVRAIDRLNAGVHQHVSDAARSAGETVTMATDDLVQELRSISWEIKELNQKLAAADKRMDAILAKEPLADIEYKLGEIRDTLQSQEAELHSIDARLTPPKNDDYDERFGPPGIWARRDRQA